MNEQFYSLGDDEAVRRHITRERDRAKKLRKSPWWKTLIQKGICHYCQKDVGVDQLTMDHLVPLARGGKSTRGNIVPACQTCNREKELNTPVDSILDQLPASSQEEP